MKFLRDIALYRLSDNTQCKSISIECIYRILFATSTSDSPSIDVLSSVDVTLLCL